MDHHQEARSAGWQPLFPTEDRVPAAPPVRQPEVSSPRLIAAAEPKAGGEPPPPDTIDLASRRAARETPATGSSAGAPGGMALVDLLAGLVEFRDPYFRGASSFTRHLASAIGKQLSLGENSLLSLQYAALLRDVGRMALNGMLIPATANVGSDERYRIERHVSLGLEMMQGVDLPDGTREAIRHHHEQWDGSGYPNGLRGEQIPILSRILQVADHFAAMISARPYRPPKRFDEAVREIREGAGHLYDPAIVDALISVISGHEYRNAGFGLHDHILIVHPDQPRGVQLAVELCSRGYLAEIAADLAAARTRLPGIPVGALLVAGDLPDGDSKTFVEHVRGIARFRDIPILGIDLENADDRIALVQAGADTSFPTDFLLDELLGTLGAALARTRRIRLSGTPDLRDPTLQWGPAAGNGEPAAVESRFAGLQGNLHDFPLSWLFQTMQYDGRSGIVAIHSGAGTGSITLHEGELYHAETESLSGEEAFNEILNWTEGFFRVHPSTSPGPRTIKRTMIQLMLEHAARNDEKHSLFGAVSTE
jgi:DNA-binding response OmpR family regulator